MFNRLLNWLIPKTNIPEEDAANQKWLHILVLSALTAIVFYFVLNSNTGIHIFRVAFLAAIGVFFIVMLFFIRRGHLRVVIAVLSLSNLAAMMCAAYWFGGVRSDAYFSIVVALVIIAMFLRGRVTILANILAITFGGILVLGEKQGWYVNADASSALTAWGNASLTFVIVSILIGTASRAARSLFERNQREIQERLKAESTLQEQARYLSLLHETTLAIINRLELSPLLESILQSALELTQTEHGYVDMYVPERRGFVKHATRGIFSRWPNQFISQEQGVSAKIFHSGKSVVIADYPSWPERMAVYASGFHAIAAAPMKARGEVIGIIGLAYTEPQRAFTPEQIQSLEQFAELAALAVDNARLYQSAQSELKERTKIQEALSESQENLRLALDAARMGLWSWDIQTGIIFWSDMIYDLFGIAPKSSSTLTYQDYLHVIHPEDRAGVEAAIQHALKNPKLFYSVEHRIIKIDGEIRWISGQGRVYTDKDGNPMRMAGMVADITERKLSEDALHQAHRQLEANAQMLKRRSQLLQVAAEVSRAASAILEPDELSQRVVDLVQQRFGLYYVGLFLMDVNAQNLILRAATGEAGREMLRAGHQFPVGNSSMVGWCVANRRARIALDVGEDAVRFNNPLLPQTRSELALPLISRGQVLGALTIQSAQEAAFSDEDIETFQTMADQLANAIQNARLYDQLEQELEERKRAEMQVRQLNTELEDRVERRTLALKASEERFRALADNNPLRIRRYDREYRYLYANRVSDDPDFEPGQIIGKTIREVVSNPALVELAERCIQQVFETGLPMQTEYQFDENSYALWYLAPEFGPDGKVLSVVTTTLDISERRRMEDELRARTMELQASNRELESFSYSVSHDLRAPLRALDGFSRILLEDFQESLPPDAVHYLNRIREAAQHMAQLVDDMLRLSRITRAELRRDSVNLTNITNQILETFRRDNPERNAQTNVQEGLLVNGDEGLLRMAMENLLNNAWKFSAKANPSKIQVGKTLVDSKETFFIRDNGVGFDMAYADKLFAVFQRLHSPNEFPGTGVGLAIVQRVIHRHGGRIWAESAPGQGATFYFTL